MSKTKMFKSITALFMAALMLFGVMPVEIFAQDKTKKIPKVEDAQYIYVDGERIALDDKRVQNYVAVPQKSELLRSSVPNVSGVGGLSSDFSRDPSITMDGTRVSALRYIVTIDGVGYEAFCGDPLLRGPESSGAVYELSGEAHSGLRNALKNGYPINSEWSNFDDNDEEDRMWWAYITRVAVAMANNPSRNFAGDDTALQQSRQLADGVIVADHNSNPAIMVNTVQNATDIGRTIDGESLAQSQPFNVTYNRKTNLTYNPFRFEWDSNTPAGAKLIVDGTVIATAPTNPDKVFNGDITSFQIEMPNEVVFENQVAKVNLLGIHNQFADKIWLLQNPNAPESWQDIVFYIPEVLSSAVFSFDSETVTDKASLRIIKRNPSGQGLAGAVFEIKGPDGYSVSMTTPSNGTILLTDLELGEYTIIETTPPRGYTLANPASVTVTLEAGSTETIERIFTNEPEPTPEPQITGVKIQKIDALTRENIPGALVRLRGISADVVVTGGTVPSTGDTHWTLNNTGINLSQVLTEGATTATGDVTSTVSDGVWSLEGLPYGVYVVEEERAPANYSLLPQHTSYAFWLLPPDVTVDVIDVNVIQDPETGEVLETIVDYEISEDGLTSSILITLENYPFGEIEVTKYDEVTGETLSGTHFRIEGYFPEGNTNGMPIDRIQVTDNDGKTVFEDLPAGQYTITEVEAPPGYEFDSTEYRSISLTWGQTASTTFYNKPKTFVEVIKVDGNDTSILLDGAIFRLSEPTSGEIWEGTTVGGKVRLGEGEGSFGNQLHEGKLYILTEIQAPNGYVLNPNPIEVIVAADNQLNTITVRNYRNPSLTIVKRDKNNGQPRLEGAVFEIVYENGTTVNGSPFTTDSNGEIVIDEILFEGNEERTLIITEIIAPDGYNLSNPSHKNVTVRKGEDNVIVFENTRKPTLEIIKTDTITGQNLEGAEFTIEKLEEPGKGMLTGNPFTTDSNGKITLPFQYSGKYRIIEVSAPNNYFLDPQQQNREWIIEVNDNEDYTLRVENTLLPTLIISKWNAVTYKPVPLTHFRIEYEVPNSSNVQLVGEFVTNSNGQIVIPYTKVGWYRITETKAAPGMSLNSNNNYRVYLNPGDNSYMPIPDVTGNNPNLNQQMPVFRDIRVFGGNDFFVSGEEQHSFPENSMVIDGKVNEVFTVANANNEQITARSTVQIDINAHIVGEFSADSSGILVLDGLEAAKYTVTNSNGETETKTLIGDGSVARFDFMSTPTEPMPDHTTPPIETNPDIETGEVFGDSIEYVDDLNLVEQISSNMSATNGEEYWNSGTGIWNWPLNSIIIKKQDATNGNLLAGATFDLIYTTSGESGTKGTVVGTFTTDHSGIIVITGLEAGNYVIEEIQAPTGYTLSLNNRQNVNLKADGTSIVEVTFSNFPYGSLLIHKIDSVTRTPLSGAQFLVTDSKGTVVGSSNGLFTTDSTGNILIEKLPPDTYIVTEQLAPSGYVIGQNSTQTIMVQPDGRVYRLEFTNDPLSSLIIRKVDSFDGSPLAGARFEVRRINGEFVGEYTTDQQGLVTIPNLLGWFTVTETEAPAGYAVDTNNVRTIEVRSQAPTYVTFYNPREGSLTIEKLDNFGNPLSGAQFRITRQNGEFVATQTSGASGMINLTSLSSGWYFVEEISAPNGYVISQVGQSVEVQPNSAAHVTFVNLPQPTLTIQKLDETGNPLSGARFMVSQIGGSFSQEVVIGAGGTASIKLPLDIPQANFQIVETQAPNGYVITEPARVITVRAGENHLESFVNYKTPSLVINKLDVDGNPLNGAIFEVRTLDGALIATATSNNGGTAAIGSIAPGNYEIRETRAPAGYVITEQSQIIQIVAGDTASVTFVNETMPGLTIEKVDETGNPLSGAEFEIRTLSGALVERVTTNSGGIANIPKISVGSYTIEETRAPNGYVLTEQARNIEISAGQNITERFVNFKQPSIVIEKVDDNGQPLANAVFEVRTLQGAKVAEVTTNNGGMAIVTGLEPNSYEVVETQAPSGYMIIEQSRIVTVAAGDVATVRFVNFRQPSLIIEKVDEDGNPLNGAEFEVRTLAGALIQRVTTNNGGVASIAEIAPGAYVITETRAPNGYVITEVARNIEIVAGQSLTERFVNYRQPSLIIEKVDENNNPLNGAVFEVRTLSGTLIAEVTTNNGGMAAIATLDPGAYEIIETLAPQGYVITEKSRNIEIVAGQSLTERFVNLKQPSLVIEKVDEDGNPLNGAEFEVRTLAGALIQRVTTDNGGVASIAEIASGAYVISETRAPDGYVITEVARNIEIVAGESITERFVNYRQPSLIIEKVDEDGNPLNGAEFEVRTLAGALIQRVTTDNGGVASIAEIALGAYVISETRAPDGYVITEVARNIEIVAGQSLTERFVNYRQPSLIIEKVDENNNPLNGAVFEVRTLTGTRIAEVTTNNGGMATVPNLEPGAYEIIETIAPQGYVITERSRNIEIVAGQSLTERFVNLKQPSLVIEKVDEDGNPLDGAEFEVRTLAGALIQRVTTDNGGVASIAEIAPGAYVISETRAPDGYVITEVARNIEIVAGESITERFVNYRQPSLIIEKVDEDGNPLNGAVFEVRTLTGTRIAEVTTNNGGMATVANLEPGAYEIIETLAPQGYVITERSRSIEIVAGQSLTERFVNLKQPSLVIEKVDEDGNPLNGAEFEVRTLAGALIQRVITDNGGVASIAEIAPGTYVISETRAPDGYVITEVARNIEIVAGESITERFVNYRQPSLIIEKVDDDGNPLNGAVFEIRTLTGTRIAEVTTNNGGMATVANLEPGAYEVLETHAPQGYVITEISRAIQIVAGETKTERFVNYRQPSLIIEKVDENGQPLAGAEFEIRRLNGELVHRVVTNNGGTATIEQLAPNSYEIIETRAPEGYAIVEVSRSIQIIAGQTVTERFVNPRLATFVIQKIDGDTNEPLSGVVFEITTLEGEHVRNQQNGSFEFITDNAGMIRLPMLEAGSYVAVETKALPGYVLAQPEVFVVGHDRDYIITIRNYKLPDYNILKIDGNTDEPLAGVSFEIAHYYANGSLGEKIRNPQDGSFTWNTDSAGLIRIPNLEHGAYIATEIRPLQGYRKAEPAIFVVGDNEPTTITVRNYRYSEWNILKVNGDTNQPLEGVIFEVAHYFGDGSTGDKLRNSITGSFEFTTNSDGLIRLGVLEPGTYVASEIRSLDGYIKAEPMVFVVTENDTNTTVIIRNYKLPTYNIRKVDGDNNQPLQGVVFEIAKYQDNGSSGERVRNPIDGSFEFVTDEAGIIYLPTLPHATYVAIETRPLDGYAIAEPHIFVVGDNQDTTITIRNYKRPDFVIRKLDGETQQPLEGVQFKIAHSLGNGNSGEMLRNPVDNGYIWTTDRSGRIHLNSLEPGVYVATESRALPGYAIAEPKIFTVGEVGDTTITIYNHRLPDYAIQKVDGDTNQPLSGVEFEIAHYLGEGRNGERLVNPTNGTTTFVTDNAGMINLPSIESGTYVAIETRPLNGYIAAESTIFTVGDNGDRTIIIRNYKQGETVLKKIDGDTDRVLAGVVFEIRRLNGELVQNPSTSTFEFTTDSAGLISLGFLTAGTYSAVEIRPLDGYINSEPTTFEVKDGEDLTVMVRNYRQASLTIRKINSVSRSPIEGVVFELSRPNGEKITNPRTGFYDFTTDRRGIIYLPALADGTYWLTEIRAADGYIKLDNPILVEINSEARQREYLLEVENTPASGLLILKTDAQTNEPLAGVVFEVRHADGRIVQGNILDGNQENTEHNSTQLNSSNGFTTDNKGRINLNHLAPGVYHVIETNPLSGYELDTTVHVVTVEPGKQTVLEVENKPLSGLRIIKTDAITGQPIFGVEFMLFDHNGKVIGNFYSDNRGMVEFPALLTEGRYTIRETRPAAGYATDDLPRTVDFVPGRVTEIEWTNMPMGGQLQISKVSGDYNEQNALPAGTPLSGAIFEIYSYRTGNLVDRIISDHRGMAVSKPLPLGRYYAVEVAAPAYYKINPQRIDFDVEFDRQIVRVNFPNYSANIGVTIDKVGPRETMQGTNIFYDIKTVRNDSTVSLTDFFWRDVLPVNAVRADKLVTGIYNQQLRYKILGKTNKGNEIVIADNLSTTVNNVVELKPVHLGLATDEYLVEFTLYFGTVPAGFMAVDKPKVYVDVLPTSHAFLPNGMMFSNKVDIGGRVFGSTEWVVGNSTTATTIYNPSNQRIPQSGY